MSSAEPAGVFPLVRHISQRLTPLLVRLPVTANQITAASLVVGLGAAWAMTEGNQTWEVAGGVLLVLCYTLDNCDGEIARLKNQCTKFGGHFDTFVDWIVHTAIFAGLGYGAFQETGESLWLWLGLLAAAGGTLNYVIGIVIDVVGPGGGEEAGAGGGDGQVALPRNLREWAVFVFRELTRADFCFIVLALALYDVVWVLLPAGAIGAQVYWLARFQRGAGDYHV
jgi:phosphatidylglycerophosphate synthase